MSKTTNKFSPEVRERAIRMKKNMPQIGGFQRAPDDRRVRSDVVAAERLRLFWRLDRQRSKRSARLPLRTSKGNEA
jgi:hypothetical protein